MAIMQRALNNWNQSTFGKSGHRTPLGSFTLPARLCGQSAVSSSDQTEQPRNSSFEFPRHCLGGLMKQNVKDDRSTNDLDYHLQNRIHQVLSTRLRPFGFI
jgi:hypothetical protein